MLTVETPVNAILLIHIYEPDLDVSIQDFSLVFSQGAKEDVLFGNFNGEIGHDREQEWVD